MLWECVEKKEQGLKIDVVSNNEMDKQGSWKRVRRSIERE